MNFGAAIELAKQGKCISRSGWNGKNMFVFMRPADELSVDFIINKVKSLPQSLKDYYSQCTHTHENAGVQTEISKEEAMVSFTAYLCLKAADGSIVNGWLASQTDILAEDWQELP
jgi:hypothetical protein